jgi:hypothetical protein
MRCGGFATRSKYEETKAAMSSDPILIFYEDDAGYEAWYDAHNPGGSVLNVKQDEVTLHRVPCDHIGRASTRSWKKLTNNLKACHPDRAVLNRVVPFFRLPVTRCDRANCLSEE